MITIITDHIQQAKDRLREQYKNSENILALIESWTGQIQELEEILFQLTTDRSIFTAIGIQLDLLGQLLNKPREGRSDTDYRIVLLAKVAQNISQGTPEELINAFKVLSSSTKVYLSDDHNGEVYLLADHVLTQEQVNMILREMYSVVCAGVRIQGLGSFDPLDSFAFDGVDVARGFGSVYDLAKGGKFATLILPNDKKFAFNGTNDSQSGFGSVYDSDVGGVFDTIY